MPKQFKKYFDFSGGMNTEADPRDIADNEVSNASNVMFDVPGKIRNMGQLGSTPKSPGMGTYLPFGVAMPNAGWGLFVFGSDYDNAFYGTPNYNPGKCVVIANASTVNCPAIITGEKFTGSAITASWGGIHSQPVFYYSDGALRIVDASFNASNPTQWIGRVNRTHFYNYTGTNNPQDSFNEWIASNAIDAPTAGLAINADDAAGWAVGQAGGSATSFIMYHTDAYATIPGKTYYLNELGTAKAVEITAQTGGTITTDNVGVDWTGKSAYWFPPAGNGFNTAFRVSATPGSVIAYELASSYMYQGDQESLLFPINGVLHPDNSAANYAKVLCTKSYNGRLTGGRVYFREYGTSDAWRLMADIDFEKGVRSGVRDTSYISWYSVTTDGLTGAPDNAYVWAQVPFYYTDFADTSKDTYETLTGIPQDTHTLAMQAKCVATGNTRAWAANVKLLNKSGGYDYFGDRIIYTNPNKYDIWPPLNYIDVGVNDGDEFKALQIYADRLLAFKNTKLYIINVSPGSDQGWFLESQHEGLGVDLPGATFRTDFGVIWANKNGCFFYDGEKLRNLLEKPTNTGLSRVISRSDWEAFISTTAAVGFDPKRRQIVVLGTANSSTGTMYIFDLATGSWAKGNRFYKAAGYYTNFANYGDELIIGDVTA